MARPPRRPSYRDIQRDIDAILRSPYQRTAVEEPDPVAAVPPPPPRPRRSLLEGLTLPDVTAPSDAIANQTFLERGPRSNPAYDPRVYDENGTQLVGASPTPATVRERENERRLATSRIEDPLMAFGSSLASGVTGMASGVANMASYNPVMPTAPRNKVLQELGDDLERVSQQAGSYRPRTTLGKVASFGGATAPYVAGGIAAGPKLAADLAVGAGMAGLESLGNRNASPVDLLAQTTKNPTLQRIADNDMGRAALDAAIDVPMSVVGGKVLGAAGSAVGAVARKGQAVGRLARQNIKRSQGLFEAPEMLGRTPGETPMATTDPRAREAQVVSPDVGGVTPDLSAFDNTVAGRAFGRDPMRDADDEIAATMAASQPAAPPVAPRTGPTPAFRAEVANRNAQRAARDGSAVALSQAQVADDAAQLMGARPGEPLLTGPRQADDPTVPPSLDQRPFLGGVPAQQLNPPATNDGMPFLRSRAQQGPVQQEPQPFLQGPQRDDVRMGMGAAGLAAAGSEDPNEERGNSLLAGAGLLGAMAINRRSTPRIKSDYSTLIDDAVPGVRGRAADLVRQAAPEMAFAIRNGATTPEALAPILAERFPQAQAFTEEVFARAATLALRAEDAPVGRAPVVTGLNARGTNYDAARALVEGRENLRDAPPEQQAAALHDKMLGDLERAIARNLDKADWYRTDVAKAKEVMGEVRPELAKDENWTVFTALAAIYSPSERPVPNFRLADVAWNSFQREGRIVPAKNAKWTADKAGIETLNRKLDEFSAQYDGPDAREQGVRDLSEWLMGTTEMRTSRKAQRQAQEVALGRPLTADEIAALNQTPPTRTVRNALLPDSQKDRTFGPKTGAFFLNLMGVADNATMDVWATRTHRRLLGYLDQVTLTNEKKLAAYLKKHPNIEDPEELRLAFTELVGTPTQAERHVFDMVTERLGQTAEKRFGRRYSRDEIQALLWFNEKEIFGAATGVNSSAQTFSQAAEVVKQDGATGRRLTAKQVNALEPAARTLTPEQRRAIEASLAGLPTRQDPYNALRGAGATDRPVRGARAGGVPDGRNPATGDIAGQNAAGRGAKGGGADGRYDVASGTAGAAALGASQDEDGEVNPLGMALGGMALGTSRVGRSGLQRAQKAVGDLASRLAKQSQGERAPWRKASIELATMKDPRFDGIETLGEMEAMELQIGAARMVSDPLAKALKLKEGRDYRATPSHGLWFSESGDAPVQPSLLLEFSPTVDKAKALAFVAEQSRIMKQAGMFFMDFTDGGSRNALDLAVRDADGEPVHAGLYLDIIRDGRQGWNGATVIDDGNRVLIVMDDGVDESVLNAELDRLEDVLEASGLTLNEKESRHVRVNAEEVGEKGYGALVDRSGVRSGDWRRAVSSAEFQYEGVAITAEKRVAAQRIFTRPDADQLALNLDPESLAAVKVGGKVYTGRNHQEAYGRAQSKGASATAMRKAYDDQSSAGYITEAGEYLTRFEGEAVLELMEERGVTKASKALGVIQDREAKGSTSWLRSEDFRSMLSTAGVGAAAAGLMAPSTAEAQDGSAGDSVLDSVTALLGAGALGAGAAVAGRGLMRRAGRDVVQQAATARMDPDPLAAGARAPRFTPEVRNLQRRVPGSMVTSPSQVNPDEHLRSDKVRGDADAIARMKTLVQQAVSEAGIDAKPVISMAEDQALARRLAQDPDGLIAAAVKRGQTRQEAIASQMVIAENAAILTDLEKRIADPATPAEERTRFEGLRAEYEAQTMRLIPISSASRSNAGRALNLYKTVSLMTMDPNVWLTRANRATKGALTVEHQRAITQFIADDDRAGLAQFVANLHKPSTGELFGSFLKAGLLMAPKTHITNLSSNATLAGMETVKDAPAAATDRLLTSIVNMIDPDKAGARRTKDFDPLDTMRASMKGAAKGIQDAKKILRGEPVGDNDLMRWDATGETRTGIPLLDVYINGPFRMLSAGDRPFRQMAIERALAEQRRVLQTTATTDDMILVAIAAGEMATFTQKTAIGDGLMGLKRGVTQRAEKAGEGAGLAASVVLETTLPFVQTPSAVLSTSAEYAAGGVVAAYDLVKLLREAKKGLADPSQRAVVEALQRRMAERVGRQVTGATVVGLGVSLAALGIMTPAIMLQDKPGRERAEFVGQNLGGSLDLGPVQASVDKLSPVGNLLTAGAGLFQALQDPENGGVEAYGKAVFGMSAAMLDQSFLRGVQDVQRATTDDEGLDRLLLNRAEMAVPGNSLLRLGARLTDRTVRDAKTPGEKFASMIPGLSRTVPAKLDALGEPVRRTSGLLGVVDELMTPAQLKVDRADQDPLRAYLRDNKVNVTRPTRDRDGGETLPEYRSRIQMTGEETQALLRETITNPEDRRELDGMTRAERKAFMERQATNVKGNVTRRLKGERRERADSLGFGGGGAGDRF